jgi:hypothetical protein
MSAQQTMSGITVEAHQFLAGQVLGTGQVLRQVGDLAGELAMAPVGQGAIVEAYFSLGGQLLRFHDAQSGDIRVDGQSIRELRLASLRGAIGLVSQDVYLFEGTVRDNIAYGRPEADEEAIIKAAQTAEAWSFIQALPDGLDTAIGEHGQRGSVTGTERWNRCILVLITVCIGGTVRFSKLHTPENVRGKV